MIIRCPIYEKDTGTSFLFRRNVPIYQIFLLTGSVYSVGMRRGNKKNGLQKLWFCLKFKILRVSPLM